MGKTEHDWDVAIVGGGPAGSTVASVLRTYAPDLRVLVLERARFPRDHVGESQLPPIGPILDEIGVWDKVEAAGFPIKIGASYTWGREAGRWDYDFFPVERWQDEPRPARFEGQRTFTAFQVDRAIYDTILLDHAEDLGAQVRQETGVREIRTDGDTITGLVLDDGSQITARHYVDASGVSAQFRRALGIGAEVPRELRNIAVWDYWQNADWAVEIGVGGTRVQVRSLSWGWIWFIPLGPTRTSIGLICPHDHHKTSGKTPAELYEEAVRSQPDIAALLENATPEGKLQACKDWSHLSDRIAGPNWFVCGEAAGFADPILAAGMTLAHTAARDVAYTILELDRGEQAADWLRDRYNTRNRENIRQHIRFAQYWYAANGRFTDLQDHCAAIAGEAGLSLDPQEAWRWLAQGGFAEELVGSVSLAFWDVASVKQIIAQFDPDGETAAPMIDGMNVFRANFDGAALTHVGHLLQGRIHRLPCWERDGKRLPVAGFYKSLIDTLKQTQDGAVILNSYKRKIDSALPETERRHAFQTVVQALEAMVHQGWVTASHDPARPALRVGVGHSLHLRSAAEADAALRTRPTDRR